MLEGETRACAGLVQEDSEGCVVGSGLEKRRLVVVDPRESDVNGQQVVIGAATRLSRAPVLVARGLRALGARSARHVTDLEGWVVARSERRVADSVYWIKVRSESSDVGEDRRKSKRSKMDDYDEVFDVYDAEYGYNEDAEGEAGDETGEFGRRL